MKSHSFQNRGAGMHRGFTLTELLVVIAIVVILVALSMMGLRRIRAMADKATSTRNISQLQIANMSYATDHNGNFVPLKLQAGNGPVTGRWFQDVDFLSNLTGMSPEELDKNIATAIPLEMLDPKVVRARKPLHNRIYTSYGMNENGLMGRLDDSPRSHNLNQIPDPGRSMVFATATDFRVSYGSRYKWDFDNPNDSKTSAGEIAYRHGDKVLVVYFDGHVGEMSKGDLLQIDRQRGSNNPFWNPRAK